MKRILNEYAVTKAALRNVKVYAVREVRSQK